MRLSGNDEGVGGCSYKGDDPCGAICASGLFGCQPAGVFRFFESDVPVWKHVVLMSALSRCIERTRGTKECLVGRLKLLLFVGRLRFKLRFDARVPRSNRHPGL